MLVTACLGLIAGCAAAGHDLAGTLYLNQQEQVDKSATGCAGTDGYGDIHDGAPVIVKDGAGAILAKGALAYAPRPDETMGPYRSKYPRQCPFTLAVAGVPAADFYVITVGSRPDLTYSAAEMAAMDWHLDLTLGP